MKLAALRFGIGSNHFHSSAPFCQRLKIFLATLLSALLICSLLPHQATAADEIPVISSEAAVLMDARTGQVLYEKNMHEKLFPASITKVLTILLGLEHGNLRDTITMSREAVYSIERGSSHIALDTGEQITLEQALMAAMLPSANDAANGIAEHIGGSIPSFAGMMNQRALETGAINSNFVNPSGLNDPAHVTTAYDMAMITRAALQNDKFREIFGTMRYTIPPTNKKTESRDLWAEHRMLTTHRYYYQGVVGGKTGYTQESQSTLTTAAQRGDRELIVVVMKGVGYNVYNDTMALFDYGFNQFKETKIMPYLEPIQGQDAKMIQDILTQNQDLSITRLLYKTVNPSDIVVNCELIGEGKSAQPGMKLDIRLNTASSMMYSDLGPVYLGYVTAANSGSSWVAVTLTIVKWLGITIASIFLILLGLRFYFRRRQMSLRRSSRISNIRIK